jgi:hypothetical protein
MGGKESKQEVFNEQINVNSDTHSNAGTSSDIKLLTTTEIFGLAILATIVCYAVSKTIAKYFVVIVVNSYLMTSHMSANMCTEKSCCI